MSPLLLPVITKLIDSVFPDKQAQDDAKLRLLELTQKGELAVLDAEKTLAVAQMEVNKQEAGTDTFRGGWRPATGWICAFGLGYEIILRNLLPWFFAIGGVNVPPLPATDIDTLMVILTGMLGLGGLRTFERIKGKA